MKIYELSGDYGDNCSFIESYSSPQESIMIKAVKQHWKEFSDYVPITLELRKSDTGKKNYKFDFSAALSPFLIFGEKSYLCLYYILKDRGQFLPVITDSKKKTFWGFYPTNVLTSNVFDLDNSDYKVYPNGLRIYKPVLKSKEITENYLFCIEEDVSRIFVTDHFKKIVEENNLIGFHFNEIELS